MSNLRNVYAIVASLVLHVLLLAGMYVIKLKLIDAPPEVAVDTVFDEERMQEQFTQELSLDTDIAENMNPFSGGVQSTVVGQASQPAVNQVRIVTSDVLQTPEIEVRVGDVTLPGHDEIGTELGEGAVGGEIGAVVDGYGAALHRLTQELIRMMRESKVLVVWLFDRSHSMTDDQQEIKENFHKVYAELGLIAGRQGNLTNEVLLTSIAQFGEGLDFITPNPTADLNEIKAAIDKITVDPSGKENMCQSIVAAIEKHRTQAARQKRKLVVVVVSDESGSDGQFVEEAVDRAKKTKAPVYVLGRESIFGYPYGRIRWIDPKYKLSHWLVIDRGPETAYPECLQWDGLRERWDAHNAGFGPYEQVRIAKETGGIFFILPNEEEDLIGEGALERKKYDNLDMREYRPLLSARREYQEARAKSKFRSTIFQAIARLNPNKAAVDRGQLPTYDEMLRIREHWYALEPAAFMQEAVGEARKAERSMALLNEAVPLLESIKPLRAGEDFQRWRAAYDLALAQCVAFRVRLFQFLLAMDEHANNMPKPGDPRTNRWSVQRTTAMLVPGDEQFQRVKEYFKIKDDRETYLKFLKAEELRAVEMYQQVISTHPRTPWARRAESELAQGFGMRFVEAYRDPNYDAADIQLPNP
ncbi:MAG TPA: vWA domain-containing protein [Planctomycetaceae bacterium]|nr:vWA domain-containing protein [Planctomycetaceae bacterium]